MRLLLFVFAMIVLPNAQAMASSVLECKVHAVVKRHLDSGLYRTQIKGAIVAGQEGAKTPCLQNLVGKTVDLKISGNPPEGKTVRLKYRSYSAMGENGAVNEVSWSYWPPGIKDLGLW